MHPLSRRRFQTGLSMVELMVAMVIALMGTIIMFQVFEVSEGIKRSTTSGGDSQQNGVIGLYVMENDLRQAGMGFNDTPYVGCTIQAYDSQRSPTDYTLSLLPVQITSGGNARTADRLTVFYGSQQIVGNATTLSRSIDNLATDVSFQTQNSFGTRVGDLVVLLEPGGIKNCSMMEVTAVPGSNFMDHRSATTYQLNWAIGTPSKNSRFNRPGGWASPTSYASAGANATRVFNLGNLYDINGTYAYNGATMPVYNTYAVSTTTLTVSSAFNTTGPAAANAVADNIVHMRALYGLDDGTSDATVPYQVGAAVAGDGKIDRFVDAPKFAGLGNPWTSVIAVRLVLVARSAQPEVGSGGPGSPCDTTSAYPTWSAQGWPAVTPALTMISLDLSADGNWQCYRYKTFETTVPLRNWIWKSS
ncbi:MAG TPA: PilW family protein [Burkholderiales bacterium]|jgi:type IV pilus assembly protein PilW